ncbi:hypothetical protein [Planococcus sp. ISL-110]|uniref:hypothetical protein n=1 Tax=Planococcus sp. ISL-110 TaxID=2819167 RepID=UPI001BE87501|nr:hypothetical protein [Planococcus sp. ISL-110]MBT2571790.1 hypothetical protein [Planococcus sp. ISL-110]
MIIMKEKIPNNKNEVTSDYVEGNERGSGIAEEERLEKLQNSIDEIIEKMDLLDEQIDHLEQNESNMTWEAYDEKYTELLDYQTNLVQQQAEYTQELLGAYSGQLKESASKTNEESKVRSAARIIKKTAWRGVKKGANYVWDNKEKWYHSLMEKGQESQDRVRAIKDKAEAAVDRHSLEELESNVQKILNKKRNEEVISVYENFYFRAAKEKRGA